MACGSCCATSAPSLVGIFVAPLNRGGIEYMVTGGLAAIVYGHPRLTLGVDLVIRLPATSARAFTALWPADEFYVPPVEVVAEESSRLGTGHCSAIHMVQGEAVQFAPIEYVILSKLRSFRDGGSDRHLRDIARMLEVSESDVDRPTLESWVERLHLASEWAQARSLEGSAQCAAARYRGRRPG